jgi:hypothetical protein
VTNPDEPAELFGLAAATSNPGSRRKGKAETVRRNRAFLIESGDSQAL